MTKEESLAPCLCPMLEPLMDAIKTHPRSASPVLFADVFQLIESDL